MKDAQWRAVGVGLRMALVALLFVVAGCDEREPGAPQDPAQPAAAAEMASEALVHGAPRIHVDESTHDFGSIVEGFAVSHVFVIQNVGDQVLRIERVYAACGCTTTALPTDRLAPGESVELGVLLDTSGFTGWISKTVEIYANDPDYADSPESERPPFTLRVGGEVLRAQGYHTSASDMNYLFYTLIDLRDREAFDAAHLIGAVSLPREALDEHLDRLPADGLLILYDQRGEDSEAAAAELSARGYTAAYYLLGGLDEWTRWHDTLLLEMEADFALRTSREEAIRLVCPERSADRRCIDTAELRYLLYVLVDVRSPDAFGASHLMGAINVPLEEVPGPLGDLPKDLLIIFYDETGGGSDDAAQRMLDAGFRQTRSLLGGLAEWTRQYGERFQISSPE